MQRTSKHLNTIRVDSARKLADAESVVMPYPEEVMILVPQYAGDESVPIVEPGTYVTKGQRIAEGRDSMPVHSSVSGIVRDITEIRISGNDRRKGIVIETDDKDKLSEYIEIPEVDTKKTFISWLKRSGILNGKEPAYRLLEKEGINELYIYAVEYEPVVASAHRCVMEDTQDIMDGISVICRHLDIPFARICIENNRVEAIERLEEVISSNRAEHRIGIKEVTSRYVQRNKKVLIYEMTGRTAEEFEDALFLDVTCTAKIGRFFKTGIPDISRRITVDGDIIARPMNVIAPIGTHIADVIEFCGGYTQTPRKIINDGTMSGRCMSSDRVPVMKDMNAIIAFEGKTAVEKSPKRCISCRECVLGCPMNLYPSYIEKAVNADNTDMLRKLGADKCIQCGSCTYICPAKRPLMKSCAKAIEMLMRGDTE